MGRVRGGHANGDTSPATRTAVYFAIAWEYLPSLRSALPSNLSSFARTLNSVGASPCISTEAPVDSPSADIVCRALVVASEPRACVEALRNPARR